MQRKQNNTIITLFQIILIIILIEQSNSSLLFKIGVCHHTNDSRVETLQATVEIWNKGHDLKPTDTDLDCWYCLPGFECSFANPNGRKCTDFEIIITGHDSRCAEAPGYVETEEDKTNLNIIAKDHTDNNSNDIKFEIDSTTINSNQNINMEAPTVNIAPVNTAHSVNIDQTINTDQNTKIHVDNINDHNINIAHTSNPVHTVNTLKTHDDTDIHKQTFISTVKDTKVPLAKPIIIKTNPHANSYDNNIAVSHNSYDNNIDLGVANNYDSNIEIGNNYDSSIDLGVATNYDSNIDLGVANNYENNYDNNIDLGVATNYDSNIDLGFANSYDSNANLWNNFDSNYNGYNNNYDSNIVVDNYRNIEIENNNYDNNIDLGVATNYDSNTNSYDNSNDFATFRAENYGYKRSLGEFGEFISDELFKQRKGQ